MKGSSGILLLYKPKGISSFEFLLKAKKALCAEKIGHTGTLDTNASGLMVVLLNDAIKEADKFKNMEKEYVGMVKFHRETKREKIKEVFDMLEGADIVQTPPVKSAVSRVPRKRKILKLEMLSFDGRNLKFRIVCEAGFYVRKFASDLGLRMGNTAHLAELKRTRIGTFSVEYCHTLEGLKDKKDKQGKFIIKA